MTTSDDTVVTAARAPTWIFRLRRPTGVSSLAAVPAEAPAKLLRSDQPGGAVLPPGTILQHMYLAERLRRLRPGRFIEVGVGGGHLSRLLLDRGWEGVGWEHSAEAARSAGRVNAGDLAAGRYELRVGDWLTAAPDRPADLVISKNVIEHLPSAQEAEYFARARRTLGPGGLAIVVVPASLRHWGVEDEVSGHLRRYTAAGLRSRLRELGFRVEHLAGLTFPLSNMLLPLSNWLVKRAEGAKCALPISQRTRLSGHREVPMKTVYPAPARVLLNPVTMYPFHVLQKAARSSPRALVVYAEARPS
jgi:SAM-dependent methyltransferase